MSFQSLAFFGFLAVALAVCLPVGRRSSGAGAALLTAASAVFYLLGPGGPAVVLGGLACLLLGICVTSWAIRRMARCRGPPPPALGRGRGSNKAGGGGGE